jgi:hypothetical protein
MSASTKSNDWECVGVATVGGAGGAGAAITMFQFRSKSADFLGEYIFVAAGVGLGGSLNSGVAPSPTDFYNKGRDINYWSKINGNRSFSADDLSNCMGVMTSAGVSAAYGYSLVYITAGVFDILFKNQYIGGWGIGVGMSLSAMRGYFIRLSTKNYY